MSRKRREWILAILCLVAAAGLRLRADDCGSPADCQAPPGNIDAATGLVAGAAAVVLYTRWRRRQNAQPLDPWADDPCSDLQRQVQLGDEAIKELERRVGQWKKPTPPPGGWPAPTTGHGPSLPSLPWDPSVFSSGALPKGPSTASPGSPAAQASATTPTPGRVAGVLGRTPGGKRKVMICKPIIGPDGEITGYAMSEEEVDDVPGKAPEQGGDPLSTGSSDSPNTVRLPGGRRLHIDPMEEWLTGKSTLADALELERADQRRRLAALAACQQAAAAAAPVAEEKRKQPVNADALAKELDDAMKRFEELQKQLKEEVGNQLNQIAKFNEDYNAAWNKGMDGLDKYLHTYLRLLPGLKTLFETFVDRNTALEIGHAIDEKIHQAIGAVMAVEGAAGLIRGVAKWAAEEGALETAEGVAGAVAKKGAAEGAEAVAGTAGRKGAAEGAEAVAGAAGREGAAAGGEAETELAGKGAQTGTPTSPEDFMEEARARAAATRERLGVRPESPVNEPQPLSRRQELVDDIYGADFGKIKPSSLPKGEKQAVQDTVSAIKKNPNVAEDNWWSRTKTREPKWGSEYKNRGIEDPATGEIQPGTQLPTKDSSGKPITYREYDVRGDTKASEAVAGRRRIVVGSNGKMYYSDHYESFVELE